MEIVFAESAAQIEQIRNLFREYQNYLNVDLCFQSFEEELVSLPGKYAAPGGALLLVVENGEAAGCVALRNLENEICEMKRLFIKHEYRGRGYGRLLAEAVINEAVKIGYSTMRLDTLERLKSAMKLYELLGFKQVEPYYSNPLNEVVYWELNLHKWKNKIK